MAFREQGYIYPLPPPRCAPVKMMQYAHAAADIKYFPRYSKAEMSPHYNGRYIRSPCAFSTFSHYRGIKSTVSISLTFFKTTVVVTRSVVMNNRQGKYTQ